MKLGLGCMRPNPNDFQNLVDYAMENGVNYFEACQFYQNGFCEEIVGKALSKYPRDSYLLCGKINFPYKPHEDIEKTFNDSLNKCQTNYFDYYLIQAVDRQSLPFLNQKNINFLNNMRLEGKIKKLGFSFHDTSGIFEQVIELNDWDCCQLQLNYYDWYLGVAEKLYSIAEKHSLPIIVMGALKGGTLTNGLPEPIKLSYQKLRPDDSFSALGYRFLKNLPNVEIILSGATTVEMLQENIDDINSVKILSETDKKVIKRILEFYSQYNTIACTNCKYCESVCPKKIPIGEFFTRYNTLLTDPQNIDNKINYYKILKSNNSFLNCAHCRTCETKCPQHLPIQMLFNQKLFPMRL